MLLALPYLFFLNFNETIGDVPELLIKNLYIEYFFRTFDFIILYIPHTVNEHFL